MSSVVTLGRVYSGLRVEGLREGLHHLYGRLKRNQDDRRKVGASLLHWADAQSVTLEDGIRKEIQGGFQHPGLFSAKCILHLHVP
jgi:hypothetical protein